MPPIFLPFGAVTEHRSQEQHVHPTLPPSIILRLLMSSSKRIPVKSPILILLQNLCPTVYFLPVMVWKTKADGLLRSHQIIRMVSKSAAARAIRKWGYLKEVDHGA